MKWVWGTLLVVLLLLNIYLFTTRTTQRDQIDVLQDSIDKANAERAVLLSQLQEATERGDSLQVELDTARVRRTRASDKVTTAKKVITNVPDSTLLRRLNAIADSIRRSTITR